MENGEVYNHMVYTRCIFWIIIKVTNIELDV